MDAATLNQTIRELLDDAAADYATDAFLQTKLNLEITSIANKLGVYNSDFEEYTIELPAVPAGKPDLSDYMSAGQPLQYLITAREIEWKLPGLDATNYFDAEGPLNKLRDIAPPGIPALDCWSYKHLMIQLSRFSTALDLRVTGDFLAPPLGASNDQVQMAQNCLPVIVHRVAKLIGVIRGNQQWVTNYDALATDAWDDFIQFVTHQRQGISERIGPAEGTVPGPVFKGLIR